MKGNSTFSKEYKKKSLKKGKREMSQNKEGQDKKNKNREETSGKTKERKMTQEEKGEEVKETRVLSSSVQRLE